MVTVIFRDPKSGTENKPQSVSFTLDNTPRGRQIQQLFTRIALAKKGTNSKYFFSRHKSRRLSETKLDSFLKKCWNAFTSCPEYEHLKSRKITMHSFRSSGICELFNSGMQIDLVRFLARHARWSTTFDSYVTKSRKFSRPRCKYNHAGC